MQHKVVCQSLWLFTWLGALSSISKHRRSQPSFSHMGQLQRGWCAVTAGSSSHVGFEAKLKQVWCSEEDIYSNTVKPCTLYLILAVWKGASWFIFCYSGIPTLSYVLELFISEIPYPDLSLLWVVISPLYFPILGPPTPLSLRQFGTLSLLSEKEKDVLILYGLLL